MRRAWELPHLNGLVRAVAYPVVEGREIAARSDGKELARWLLACVAGIPGHRPCRLTPGGWNRGEDCAFSLRFGDGPLLRPDGGYAMISPGREVNQGLKTSTATSRAGTEPLFSAQCTMLLASVQVSPA